jgi:hypothetical protein
MTRKLLVLLLLLMVCLAAVPAFAASVRVKAGKTPLWATPTRNAIVVGQLKAGAILDVVDVTRDWYKVRDPQTKQEGYVLASAVDLQPGPAPTAASGQKTAAPPPAASGLKTAAPPPAAKRAAARPVRKGGWTDRGYLSVGGLFQTGGTAITQTQTWPYFAETATTSVTYPAKGTPGFDVGGGFRIWRNLAMGIGVTRSMSRSTTATVAGSIPSPLYVNQPRTLSGGFAATNVQTGVFLQAAWAIPMSPKMTLVVFAGPAIFSVQQTIVQPEGISVSSVYPYDSGAVTSAETAETSKTAVGFGVGADFSYYFSKNIGVGSMIRFASASASFPVDGQPAVSVDAGGFQVGVGLRIRFPSSMIGKPGTPVRPQPKPLPKPKAPPRK